jgi:hypothetical protein
MDPLDVRIIQEISRGVGVAPGSDLAEGLVSLTKINRDEIYFSLAHLHELGCLNHHPDKGPKPTLSTRRRLLIAVVSD